MNAVKKVFPNARHRLCLWHILKKFPEKLSHHYFEGGKFKTLLSNCIYQSVTTFEFESSWEKIMQEFKLENHIWLTHLFSIWSFWIPVYMRNTFLRELGLQAEVKA